MRVNVRPALSLMETWQGISSSGVHFGSVQRSSVGTAPRSLQHLGELFIRNSHAASNSSDSVMNISCGF